MALRGSAKDVAKLKREDGLVFVTQGSTELVIVFVDDTRFVVGPNSRVLIDSFVFDPNKTATDVGINAVKGAFRFISGASPKSAYAIRTPTMTIGVRGTAFDLSVRPGGELAVAVHEGAVRLCDVLRRCMEAPAGDVVVATPGGLETLPPGLARRQRLATFFPYIKSQRRLRPIFRLPTLITLEGTSDRDPESGEDKRADNEPPPRPDPAPRREPRDPPDGRPPDGRPP